MSHILKSITPLIFVVALLPSAIVGQDRPNIILCMADDQGWGDVGFRGHPHLKTPVMDELAATTLCFDRFYAAAPVCSPTRGSVMTGRHPNRFGCFSWGYTLRPQELTIAEVLRDNGYTTGHFGKWHIGSCRADNPANPGNSGFDHWLSAPNFYENNPILSREGVAEKTEGEGSLVTVDAALEFIQDAKTNDQPFFAVIWFGSPHGPHQALPDDLALYSDLPERLQHFYGEITAMDRALGHLREQLRDMEIADNTILWYTSDNGALKGVGNTAGLKGRKGDLGEGGLRVPSMVEWPARIQEPIKTSFPANTVDIFPTILDLLEIEVEDSLPLDGISLVSFIEEGAETRPRPMGFWVYPTRGISTPSAKIMRDMWAEQNEGAAPVIAANEEAWKMSQSFPADDLSGESAWIDNEFKLHRTQDKNGEATYSLYNLVEDVAETTDLVDQQPERVANMRAALEAWQQSVIASMNGADYPDQ